MARLLQTAASVTEEPRMVLSQRIGRTYLLIQNKGPDLAYVGFEKSDNTRADDAFEVRPSGGNLEIRGPCAEGAVFAACAAAKSARLVFLEG